MKKILLPLQNQNGNTLIENLVAVFLLAVFSLLAAMLLLVAANKMADIRLEDAYISDATNAIETVDTSTVTGASGATASDVVVQSDPVPSALSFSVSINGVASDIEIDGTYIYDQEGYLGEFVREETP